VSEKSKPHNTITDFITGKEIPDIGAEANRQAVARYLVNEKGYAKEDIAFDVDILINIAGEYYQSQLDLVVSPDGGKTYSMILKCPAGSPGSWERETLAAARLLEKYQIPLTVVSDGITAIVLDTTSGKKLGEGLNAIPSKKEAIKKLRVTTLRPLPEERIEREKLIFRSYDSMRVNVKRKIS
jgi:hypothetical protein